MNRALSVTAVLGLAAILVIWMLSRPQTLPDGKLESLNSDAGRGETIFWAGGCASCHAPPKSEGPARLVLGGGNRIESPFGTFVSPNISPSPEGIGGWTTQDLANALLAGVSPKGAHYFPSLPYTSYRRMTLQDVADLKAFLDKLPPSDKLNSDHELPFPFSVRRAVGLWKKIFLIDDWVVSVEGEQLERGRYLVEALGHCTECHTPRNAIGGLDRDRWLQGAPNPAGKGQIPAIGGDALKWSVSDIAYYLESGIGADYETAGGEMVDVIRNISQLSSEDRAAIAAYLKAVPPVEHAAPKVP